MSSRRALPFLLLSILLPLRMAAQEGLDPASTGMARSGVALSRGIGTLATNPGGIDFRVDAFGALTHRLTASPYTFGGTLGSTYLSSDDFEDIFGARPQGTTDEDRQRLGDLLQDRRLYANGGVALLQGRLETESGWSFGLQYSHRLFARMNFPDSFGLLVKTGNITGEYRFLNRGVGGSWVTQLGLTAGTRVGGPDEGWFPELGIGATIKLIRGVAHFDIEEASALSIEPIEAGGTAGFLVQGGYVFRSAQPDDFQIEDAPSDFRSALFPKVAGFGVGADFGLSGILYRRRHAPQEPARDAVFYGIVLQDVGSINWSDNTYERVLQGVNDTLRTSSLSNEQFRRYEGVLQPVGDFSTALPAVLRIGLGFDLAALGVTAPDAKVRVGVEGEFPLNSVPGNPEHPRIAGGAEWGLNEWLVLRAGVAGGGIGEVAVGIGLGIRPLNWLALDVGSSEASELIDGERVDIAIRLTVGLDAMLR